MTEALPRRRGRRAQDRDAEILTAARALLAEHLDASMAEIGAAATVGMSALYRRFGSKEALVRRLADDANAYFASALDEAVKALDAGVNPQDVLAQLLTANVESDFWALTTALDVHFEREQHEIDESDRLRRVTTTFVESLRAAGALRAGIDWLDLAKLLEGVGAVRGDGPERTRNLQRRTMQVVLAGLAPDLPAITDPHAQPRDFQYRQRRLRRAGS